MEDLALSHGILGRGHGTPWRGRRLGSTWRAGHSPIARHHRLGGCGIAVGGCAHSPGLACNLSKSKPAVNFFFGAGWATAVFPSSLASKDKTPVQHVQQAAVRTDREKLTLTR